MKRAIKKVLGFALVYLMLVGCLLILSNRVQKINNLNKNQQTYYEYEVEHK